MKKLLAALLCCGALLTFGVPVYASDTDPQPETTITRGPTEDGGDAIMVQTPPSPPPGMGLADVQPIQVRMEMVGDVPYITKVYELDRTGDMMLAVNGFVQDDYTFTRHAVYEQMQPDVVDTRLASQTATVPVNENSTAAVLAIAAPYLDYAEDGYTGQLALDAASIHIEEAGHSSYAYRVTDVREYNALDRNDAAYIPKTVQKNGMTLQLENIEWVVMGTTPSGDSLVPSLFKAIATYAGSATGSQVEGYLATVQYTGMVEKATPGKCLYSVVFRGVPVGEPATPVWPYIAVGVGGLLVLGGLGVLTYRLGKKSGQRAVKDAANKWDWEAFNEDD